MRCARGGSEHGAAGAKERLENHADSIISTLTLSRLLRGSSAVAALEKLRWKAPPLAALESFRWIRWSALPVQRQLSRRTSALLALAFQR